MDKLRMESPDMVQGNVEKIAALFPNCVTEGPDGHGGLKKAVDFDKLRQMLSGDVLEGDEAYEFTWVGKKAAMVEANKPTRQTLRPCPEESKNWDTTENLYIEGDNLQVLKLLQESYLGKVKMIYIDPPYNTGHDFIYNDHFKMDKDEYEQQTSMFDEEGNRNFTENTDSNPRFHSDWCSMMYPRLMLARNLLTDSGIIISSISEREYCNLRRTLDEVFGESNKVGTVVWKNATDNNPTNIAEEHEYLLVYAKNKWSIQSTWKSRASAVKDVLVNKGTELINQYHDLNNLKAAYDVWYKENKAQLWPLDRYKYIDFGGIYTGSQSVHNPGKEGYRYDVIHPITKKPCKQPLMGYRFPKETMDRLITQGKIIFGKDERKIIELKLYASEYQEKLPSVYELDGRLGAYDLKQLFPETVKAFTNPKPVQLIKMLLSYVTENEDLVMDFFSGSATTAHAVMQLNAEDGGHRKFIMVQLPEACDEKSEAYKAGYKTICDIGKERIRRAGTKIQKSLQENGGNIRHLAQNQNPPTSTYTSPDGQMQFDVPTVPPRWSKADESDDNQKMADALDTGFRVFKLADSNMQDVYFAPDDYSQDMLSMMESNIKPDRTALDLLFGCLLEWGLSLSMPYRSETIDGCTVHTYNDGDLIACFDENIPRSVVEAIARRQPLRAVFRDSSFSTSPEKINLTEVFKLLAPDTRIKVI